MIARPTARPSSRQRAIEGSGCCTVLIATGTIVGRYQSADGKQHRSLLKRGRFTTLDVPGATFTATSGINPAGEIVGRYGGADGVVYGFLLSRKELGKRKCGLPISDCGLSQLTTGN